MYNPNYLRILNSMRQKIEEGIYKNGQRIPGQYELAEEYGVSMMTLRHAMDILEQEGYITRKQGMGTFVTLSEKVQGSILIVEDEAQARELLKDIVSTSGYEVITAEDGYEAVAAVQKRKFKLIFLDLRLPNLSGIETLKRIKEIDSSIPIVVVTGYPEDLMAVHNRDGWPATVIPKPFKLSQIREALNMVKSKK